MNTQTRLPTFALLAVAAFLAVALVPPPAADATHQPADKMAVSGAALEILTSDLVAGSDSLSATLLTGRMKTSSPTDLVFTVSLECALWTDVTTVGNDESESSARVVVWVEVDGAPVPVSGDDTQEPGKVVFCDRTYRRETLRFDDEDATIATYLRTRSAHAFRWVDLDLGSGLHTIEVKAELETSVAGTGMAKAAIGKRTLVVEPVKLANDVQI